MDQVYLQVFKTKREPKTAAKMVKESNWIKRKFGLE